ncbi:TonB-dependent receptor [Pontibacter diazotrophicus]|uniref:TonB-dependent receptor n=1 Tax=Pontibacter diazotrophicus TaxID=1400979 RepID=A0A3D8L7I8_9BACT|nr:outer membrane beta-barrel family protein [Pontibacter diazotrophicus]RDV12942.1 TonB-dependent receptor [Pontibacter diazotrophicus]
MTRALYSIKNSTRYTAVAFLLLLLFPLLSLAQVNRKAAVRGKVLDAQTGLPLPYANVRLFKSVDNGLISGNMTDEEGQFTLDAPLGEHYALIDFMGYKALKSTVFTLTPENPTHHLGTLKLLVAEATALKEVVVQAEKSTMELSLDKKIFNVGKDLANAGGSATEILSNIPSVSVDAEGNVKLRGSGNVRILIDGKPSGLVSFKGGSGLQQLQGSLIEKVEIITNPSARYEAEGMSGIINIVLKKERKSGFNGSFEVIAGEPTNYGGAANVNYRHKKINFFLNYGLAYRITPSLGSLYQELTSNNTTSILRQEHDTRLKGFNNNIRGGLDYFFTETSILTASYMFRRSDANRVRNIRYEDYLASQELQSYTARQQVEDEDEVNAEYAISYKKTFAREGQELNVDFRFLDYWENSDQVYTQNTFFPDGTPEPATALYQRSLNDEYEKQYLTQVDYVQPIGEGGKLEAGLRSSFRDMVNDYLVGDQNAAGEITPLPGLENYFIYNENINALYGILGNKTKKVSYQVGLRAEHTDVKTTLRETNEVNPRRYTNLFPSAHFTYNLPKENALQISYSRRVRRPVYFDLSPYFTLSDSRNVMGGNPNLNPEFTNAFDFGHIKYFEKGSMSSSLFYRHTTGRITTIRRVNNEGIATLRPENLEAEDAFGLELIGSFTPATWWKMDHSFNFFRAIIDGSNFEENFSTDTYSWFTRHTSRFTLPKAIDLQVRANYEAPQKTPQGTQKALYYVDLGISKDIFNRNGTITLNALDLFNSRITRSVQQGESIEGVSFYTSSKNQGRRRQVNLTLSYRLHQAAPTGSPKTLSPE